MNRIAHKIRDARGKLSDYINSGSNEVGKTNLNIMRIASNLTFLFTALFIGLTPVFIEDWVVTKYHFICMGCMLFFSVIAEVMTRKKVYKKSYITVVVSTFMLSLMVNLILLDTIPYPFASEVFVVVFLVVAPILFIVPFEAMLGYQVFCLTVFIVMAHLYKEPQVIGRDCFQTFYGACVGVVLYFVIMRLRMQEFEQRSIYKVSSEMDYLTQIYNRATSKNKIDQYLVMKDDEKACAMLVVDVDKFKEVNDKYGHEKGDEVLKALAGILKRVFRNGDVIGRFGGDEFIAFMKDIKDEEILAEKCRQINQSMENMMGDTDKLSCSIGLCILEKGSAFQEEMFRVADEALYEAKAYGRATYVLHRFEKNRKK